MFRIVSLFFLLVSLSGCFALDFLGFGGSTDSLHGYYKVGAPYEIRGKWYYPKVDYGYDEVGLASWYGGKFHGRKTANGAIFNKNKLTAAHKTLPLPSYVRVENLRNGRKLKLLVNDRGPFVSGRIIDVSRAAAEKLGFRKQGVTRVRVSILPHDSSLLAAKLQQGKWDKLVSSGKLPGAVPADSVVSNDLGSITGLSSARASSSVSASGSRLFVHIGGYSDYVSALKVQRRVRNFGSVELTQFEQDPSPLFLVRLGPFGSQSDTDRALKQMRDLGYRDAHIVRIVGN